MKELQLGQKVEILVDTTSVNKKGDVGTITEFRDEDKLFRVTVVGKKNFANWQAAHHLKVVE